MGDCKARTYNRLSKLKEGERGEQIRKAGNKCEKKKKLWEEGNESQTLKGTREQEPTGRPSIHKICP